MAAEVRVKVLELYLHDDPAVKQAADAALCSFQESDLAWHVALELLVDTDASVQFFAAQTLYNKVQQVAKGYQQAEGGALRGLVPALQRHLGSPAATQQCRQRLTLALAAIAVHLCTDAWPTAIADVLSLVESQPHCAWGILLAIPEQLSSVVHTYLKTDRRTEALLAGSPGLVAAALRCEPAAAEEPVTGTIADSPFSLAMQCLAQWSKVMGMQPLLREGFAGRLAALLRGPSRSSEPVLELLVEVLQGSTGAFAVYADRPQQAAPGLEGLLAAVVGTMEALLPSLQQTAERPAASLDEADAARLCRWARVAGTLVEAYTQILWVERAAADVVIAFLAACFLVHPHVAQSVFELWAVLKDASRDKKLPPGVIEGLLRRLSAPCLASLVRFGRLDAPHAEDRAALSQLRDAQQDIVVDMVCIAAGTSEAQHILALLQEHLMCFQRAKDWHGVEVVWFAFNGIAEALADEPVLPEVYQFVVQSIFQAEACTEDQCATAAVLLRTCGPHFEQALRRELVPAVQWLVGRVPQIPSVASEAVQEVCGYAGRHLVPHIAEFLQVVEATAPLVPADVDAALHGALVGIARNLPAEQAVEAFVQICRGTTAALSEAIDVASEAGCRTLHRCTCRLLRCTLVMEQAGSSSGGAQEPTPGAQASATCLARVLLPQWPSLVVPCRRLLCAAAIPRDAPRGKPMFEYSDAAVQVNVLALLRYAARAASDARAGGPELGGHLVNLAEACCREGQLACLHALSVLAANLDRARADILPALDAICRSALAHVQAGRSAEDLVPFLELTASLAASVGNELFQSAQLDMLVQLNVLALRSPDQDILKPVLLFLQKLLMARPAVVSGKRLLDIVQAVLANFHTWPRSMGAQTFKLFSALLERHEVAFLQLALSPAVPALAALPPAEQLLAQRALQRLRGPKLRAFLGDLGAVARSENSLDVLQAYGVEG